MASFSLKHCFRTVFRALSLLLILAMPVAGAAESMQAIKAYELVKQINDDNPAQSGFYTSARDVLTDRVLDKTNRVVGDIRDMSLDKNGSVVVLDVDLNRLSLDSGRLPLGYDALGFRVASNGYKMNYTDNELEMMLPSLLDEIPTAGGNGSGLSSLNNLMDKVVKNVEGQTIGRVEDVFFNVAGSRAKLLYVKMKHKTLAQKRIAIPYAEGAIRRGTVVVTNEVADAMKKYARKM